MNVSRRPPLHRILVATGILASIASAAQAELIVGLTTANTLISFDSATPGSVASSGAITGLAAGDTLVGIDRRPSNGVLYAVGVNPGSGSARIYTLNQVTAAATLVATLVADPADATAPTPFTTVTGTSFGMDFNPVVDRLRLVSSTGQNLRINVATGLTQLDVPLAYALGDPNAGDAPVDVAIAYSNNVAGAVSTTLRGVDIGQDADALVVHANPNGGLLTTSLTLPFNATEILGYDVSGLTGTPYFSPTAAGSPVTSLYAAGPGGVTLVGDIGGGETVLDIAAPVGIQQVVPEPGSLLLAASGLAGLMGLRLRRRRCSPS